jgi:hypothetical protein
VDVEYNKLQFNVLSPTLLTDDNTQSVNPIGLFVMIGNLKAIPIITINENKRYNIN